MRDRSKTCGASEVAALFDESPFESRYSLWAKKTGLIETEPWDAPTTDRMQIGKDLERPVLEIWAKRVGFEVVHNAQSFASRAVDGLSATPDGKVIADRVPDRASYTRAVVDVKTVQPHARKAWAETGTPRHYWWQLQAQMMCLEVSEAYLVALFGVNEIAHDLVKADPEAHARIAEEVALFWQQVRGEAPPPEPDGHRASLVAVLARKREPQKTIELGEDLRTLMEDLDFVRRLMATNGRREKEIKAQMIRALGDASCGVFSDGSGWKMRVEERKESVVKAHKRQVLVPFVGKDAEEGNEDE